MWQGPFRLRECLDRPGGAEPLPPEAGGVYLFSLSASFATDQVLYVGDSHVSTNQNIRNRIGEEITCLLGFHGEVAGYGWGGILLSEHCRSAELNPLDLHLAWRIELGCPRLAEQQLYDSYKHAPGTVLLNRRRPQNCGACHE